MSCRRTRAASIRALRSARARATATAAITARNRPAAMALLAVPPSDSKKKSESRMTAPKSAIVTPAIVSWPSGRSAAPASLRTGTTSPSEVAASAMATNNGLLTHPAASKANPAASPTAMVATNPSRGSRNRSPRRRMRSISRPARKSRNASPTRASTAIGGSISTQPSTAGPTTMPARISMTTPGTFTRGIPPASSGATTAITATTNSPPNESPSSMCLRCALVPVSSVSQRGPALRGL